MTGVAEALFQVPPFPGAKPVAIVRPAPAPRPVDGATAAAFVAAVRRERVGGAYWGAEDPWRRFDSGGTLRFERDDPVLLPAAENRPDEGICLSQTRHFPKAGNYQPVRDIKI